MKKRIVKNKLAILYSLILFYLYFRGIGDHGLIDPVEGVNASIALHMSAGGSYFVPKIGEAFASGSTMGSWWLCALGLKIFGWGEFAVRFFSALSGLGMILASALSAFNPERKRQMWLSSSICASMILCFGVSQICSSHAIFSCLTALSMTGIINSQYNKKWLILSHISISLAFISHGPSGLFLPFLCVIIYSVLSEDFELMKDFFTWPFGIIITILISGIYFASLMALNPKIILFMFARNYSYSFGGIAGSIVFVLVSLTPFQGFILRALFEIFPREYPAEQSTEFFLLVWSLVFGISAVLTGDIMMICASIPALSSMLARKLDFWFDENIVSVVYSFLINLLILFPILLFMPFSAKFFPVVKASLMSLIPYELLMLLFLLASWYYTKTRQIKKWVRNVLGAALVCLMPLAGVFNLIAEDYSVKEIGLSLRDVIKGKEAVIQYHVNYPSMYFYTLRNSVLINSKLNLGIEEKKFTAEDSFISASWKRKDRCFLVLPEDDDVKTILPKAANNIYHISRAEGMLLLSNQ